MATPAILITWSQGPTAPLSGGNGNPLQILQWKTSDYTFQSRKTWTKETKGAWWLHMWAVFSYHLGNDSDERSGTGTEVDAKLKYKYTRDWFLKKEICRSTTQHLCVFEEKKKESYRNNWKTVLKDDHIGHWLRYYF